MCLPSCASPCVALLPVQAVSFLPAIAFYPSFHCGGQDVMWEVWLLVVFVLAGDCNFFSGEWCPTHPSIALSCPVDSCYSLWRSQSLGPDEQGLIHLTGRYLSTAEKRAGDEKGSVKWAQWIQQMCPHNCKSFGSLIVPATPSPRGTVWLLFEQF